MKFSATSMEGFSSVIYFSFIHLSTMDDLRDSEQCPKSMTLSNVCSTKNGMIYETLVSVANSVILSNVRVTKYGMIYLTLLVSAIRDTVEPTYDQIRNIFEALTLAQARPNKS